MSVGADVLIAIAWLGVAAGEVWLLWWLGERDDRRRNAGNDRRHESCSARRHEFARTASVTPVTSRPRAAGTHTASTRG